MNWISVEDRLPEGDKPKPVLASDGKLFCVAILVKGKEGKKDYLESDICTCCDFDYDMMKITHWMPMPELPEKK